MENDIVNETNKFKWLVKQNVLTEDVARQKIEELKFYHQNKSSKERVLN